MEDNSNIQLWIAKSHLIEIPKGWMLYPCYLKDKDIINRFWTENIEATLYFGSSKKLPYGTVFCEDISLIQKIDMEKLY